MPALLATLHDLIVGLGIASAVAAFLTGLAYITGKAIRNNSQVEPPRLLSERERPVDLAGAIEAHRELRGRR